MSVDPTPTPDLTLDAIEEAWPIDGSFVISRGAKTQAHVVVATVGDGRHTGRGEAVPYARYGETIEGTLAAISTLPANLTRTALQALLPAGAARNAVDCALWDLEAKQTGQRAETIAACGPLRPVLTCYTLSLDAPERMAAKARAVAHLPVLKLKLGDPQDATRDVQRMRAVRAARPDARLVADANEAWQPDQLIPLLAAAAAAGVEMIEQPLPVGKDAALSGLARPVPVCADESAHTAADLAALADRYDAVNVKLDKAGGLTAALAMMGEARRLGLDVMVGCMVATSLAMAPALLLAQSARWVDLDGPLLLAGDRANGLHFEHGIIHPHDSTLWG